MVKECAFCKIYKEKEEIVYQNPHFFARYDKFPVAPGHAEIIPKRHVSSLFELTEQEWFHLQYALSDVVHALLRNNDFKTIYQGFIYKTLNPKSLEFCKKMLTHVGINKNPDGYNIGINEGEAAGRTIPHLHIHIIPRYFGDVEDPAGGVRNIIPGMGNYRK